MESLLLTTKRRSEQRSYGERCSQIEESDIHLAFRPTVLKQCDDAQAEHLAHSYLVAACEQALFDLLCSAGDGKSPEDVRIGLMASDLVREILTYWRGRLEAAKAPARANEREWSLTFTAH
ncbi:MAG: hypothetical protein ABSC13_04230 [Dehalococcoidia bacterium]|jgi:hypothetical protein